MIVKHSTFMLWMKWVLTKTCCYGRAKKGGSWIKCKTLDVDKERGESKKFENKMENTCVNIYIGKHDEHAPLEELKAVWSSFWITGTSLVFEENVHCLVQWKNIWFCYQETTASVLLRNVSSACHTCRWFCKQRNIKILSMWRFQLSLIFMGTKIRDWHLLVLGVCI